MDVKKKIEYIFNFDLLKDIKMKKIKGYKLQHTSKVHYSKQLGYRIIMPRWYAMEIDLQNGDVIEWSTDGEVLQVKKVKKDSI